MNSKDSYLIKFLALVVQNCQQEHFLPYINHSVQDPGGLLGLIFAWYVPLASHNPYPVIVYFVAKYRPHPRHFWKNVIFAIPTYCAFHKHANSELQKPTDDCVF